MDSQPNPLTSKMDDQIVVANVAFGEEYIEVDFFDPRRQAPGIVEFTKLSIERGRMIEDIEPIEEMLVELIDEALRRRRK